MILDTRDVIEQKLKNRANEMFHRIGQISVRAVLYLLLTVDSIRIWFIKTNSARVMLCQREMERRWTGGVVSSFL